MNIHPYLLARAYAIQAAYAAPGFRSAPVTTNTNISNGNSKPMPNPTSIWDDLLKDKEEDEGDAGSGGGTMKGLRGKNHLNAMRRLGR